MQTFANWLSGYFYTEKKELPERIKDVYNLIVSFLDNGIVEISLIDQMVKEIQNEENKKEVLGILLSKVTELYQQYTDEVNQNQTIQKFYTLINISLFLFFVMRRMGNYYEIYIEMFVNKQQLWKAIISFFEISRKNFNNCDIVNIFIHIINSITKDIDKDKDKEGVNQLENEVNEILTKINALQINIDDITKTSNETYENVLLQIKNFNFAYEDMFNNDNLSFQDKKIIKSHFIQSIIRFVLSPLILKISPKEENFISSFIQSTLEKSAEFYLNKIGKSYRCIFRREQLYDDIIKFFFFSFGNEFYSKYFFPLLEAMCHNNVTKENFMEFSEVYFKFLDSIYLYLPKILIVILKIAQREFALRYELDKDNYYPCIMLLFFSFLCSPKLEVIYNVELNKNVNIVNKILMNICFNQKFEDKDKEYIFLNDFLHTMNKQTKKKIERMLRVVEDDKMEETINKDLELFNMNKSDEVIFAYDCNVIQRISKITKS